MALGFRLSADELIPTGLKPEESSQVARWLEESGDLDYLSISHSVEYDYMSVAQQFADMTWGPAPFVHLAEGIKTRRGRHTHCGRVQDHRARPGRRHPA